MFIAVYINAIVGVFEPYGLFSTREQAVGWIEETGIKKWGERSQRSLWAAFEVNNLG